MDKISVNTTTILVSEALCVGVGLESVDKAFPHNYVATICVVYMTDGLGAITASISCSASDAFSESWPAKRSEMLKQAVTKAKTTFPDIKLSIADDVSVYGDATLEELR